MVTLKTQQNLIKKNNTLLLVETRALHQQHKKAYGSRRIAKALQAMGHKIGRYKARKLMREAGIECKQRRRYRHVISKSLQSQFSENILDRKFSVDAPNKVWVADMTYIWTREGWLYVAAVLDLFSRMIVGWESADCMGEALVCDALKKAITLRQPAPGLLHHSDRGSQYSGHTYRALLKKHGIESSMSRKGNCWDNAVMERFFGSLKSEYVDGKAYTTRQDAKAGIIDYIERFYNAERLHCSIGYVSPRNYELSYRQP